MEIKYYLESNIPQISPQQGKLNFYCFIYAIFFRKKNSQRNYDSEHFYMRIQIQIIKINSYTTQVGLIMFFFIT